MAGLLADAKAASTRHYQRCGVAVLVELLGAADAAELAEALADVTITGAGLAAALKAAGHPVAAHTVQRHRTGKCRCDSR